MKEITTIGLDLAKQIFQVHAADFEGAPVISRKLRRATEYGSGRGLFRRSGRARARPASPQRPAGLR